MNPFSRRDWKKEARKVQKGEGGPGWAILALLLALAVLKFILGK